MLIAGASGEGKSSLLRAIAGLWTSGNGIIVRPKPEEMLFLPQPPYMILRSQVLELTGNGHWQLQPSASYSFKY